MAADLRIRPPGTAWQMPHCIKVSQYPESGGVEPTKRLTEINNTGRAKCYPLIDSKVPSELNMMISKDIANTIVDPRAYSDPARIDAAFTAIRRDTPFAQAEPDNYDRFWVAAKHADLLDIERQAAVFANGAGPTNLGPSASHAMVKAMTGEPNLIRTLVSVDGEEHKALRALTFPALTPRSIRQYEDLVRGIAKEYVSEMLDRAPQVDFASEIAFHYPLRVIMSLLGVPKNDEGYLLKLTQQLFGGSDPEMSRAGKAVSGAEATNNVVQVMIDLENYFEEVTNRFRATPDFRAINSLIANAKIGGEYLNRRQLMGYYIIAATAGHDTTANTTASAMWALAERPELLAQLKSTPEAIAPFIEESIRWATPVKTFMRTAVADGMVNGKAVAKGDWLLLSYHSANRDEDVFDEPFEFRIDRNPNKQVAFGSGPHVCLGQHLARFEMRLLWEELLPRLGKVELAGQPTTLESCFVVGPKSVPLRFTVQ